eukprot:Gregarina_sp_Pseudo_9__3847@NODE_39_length_5284_cov_104_254719_g36_i0_p3_GENE_NODE_39_length_5284_cov_104_254719_g36_i0NODE_39_length_5284_cov_104_254719_g36_i0_p3_ORF_typecomplete_len301_score48_30_NODE_39_length_5284_cov_104_254719_g36_i013752277
MPQDSIVDRLVELAQSQDTIVVKQGQPAAMASLFEGPLSPSTAASASASSHPTTTRDSLIMVAEAGGKHVFRDSKTAALFLLLLDQTPISEFVTWASQQRNGILQAPTKVCKDEAWKYLLLQDSSLEAALPTLMTTTTTAGSIDHAFASTAVSRTAKSNTTPDKICESGFWSPPDPPANHQQKGARRSEAPTYSSALALEPPKAKRARTLSQLPQTTGLSENENRANGAARARGSTRRLPELEGVIVCPDCSRKGQSIFDPNNSNPEGVVWQYFYCRNVDCIRGRSSSRYIGWTTRRKGS